VVYFSSGRSKLCYLTHLFIDIKNLREFTLFPQLPTELRIKIWNVAILPRIVFMSKYNTSRGQPDRTSPLYTPCIPSLLQVSREARQIGLENYKRSQGLSSNLQMQIGPIYFNLKLDTLLCACWDGTSLRSIEPNFLKKVLSQARQLCLHVGDVIGVFFPQVLFYFIFFFF
jgi:hypothetical protein